MSQKWPVRRTHGINATGYSVSFRNVEEVSGRSPKLTKHIETWVTGANLVSARAYFNLNVGLHLLGCRAQDDFVNVHVMRLFNGVDNGAGNRIGVNCHFVELFRGFSRIGVGDGAG